jgi:hypothetical protein
MSFPNSTPIQIGMTCRFSGQPYRVAGRLVLGMEEEGKTYYWTEFNLQTGQNQGATLVYEETDDGDVWRLFTLFEPKMPQPAAWAAQQRVGQAVDVDGVPYRVTLVDESQVYAIEGEAPEGVEVGDIAHYFNAEKANRLVVVSWTGDEVEYFRGVNIPASAVASAFGLPRERLGSTSQLQSQGYSTPHFPAAALAKVVAFLAVGGLLVWWTQSPHTRPFFPPVVKTRTPMAPLVLGASGRWDNSEWQITQRLKSEVAQVGQVYDQHEYLLSDDTGKSALLVFARQSQGERWYFYTRLSPANFLTPRQAAAKKAGQTLTCNGVMARVVELFQTTVREIQPVETASARTGEVFYGFQARAATNLYLVRWNTNGLTCHWGATVPGTEVLKAFRNPD